MAGTGHVREAQRDAARACFDDCGILRIPPEPHDARHFGLGHDVHLRARFGLDERVRFIVRNGKNSLVMDLENDVLEHAPRGGFPRVVTRGEDPLTVDEARAEIDVMRIDHDLLALDDLLVIAHLLLESRVVGTVGRTVGRIEREGPCGGREGSGGAGQGAECAGAESRKVAPREGARRTGSHELIFRW